MVALSWVYSAIKVRHCVVKTLLLVVVVYVTYIFAVVVEEVVQ